LNEGALDVTLAPIFMKKNRAATMLTVICGPEQVEEMTAVVFSETSTLGMRIHQAERRVLARSVSEVETPYGKIHVKHSENGTASAEFDDCRRAAIEHKVPLRTVISAAVKK
jgi:pyridinium-3,5-bisthiocarboxylic acid mononucleotide nickel chelatase